MEKIPCSVEILTLNSAKTLSECLESVVDFNDVFIVDGNSTDETRNIASRFGASIYFQSDSKKPNQRIESFGKARKYAESFAKHDWLLYLDSDEYLSKEVVEEIRSIFKSGISIDRAYSMPYCMIIDGKKIFHSFSTPRYVRLYNRKSGIVWKNKVVHEKMDIPKTVQIVSLNNFFFGYVPSFAERIKKDNYYLNLMKDKLVKKIPGASKVMIVKSAMKNSLRSCHIIFSSFFIYLRFGFKKSIPLIEVWRYVRYHLFIVYYRFRQFLLNLT